MYVLPMMSTAEYVVSELKLEFTILAVALLVYVAVCVYTYKPWARRKMKQELQINPPSLVGYKRAVLTLEDKPFMGVYEGSSPYSIVDEAAPKSPGFHAYYDLGSALAHPQVGNLYLEILSHGKVEHHELGMTTEKQTVLQLMVGDCTACAKDQAVRWVRIHESFHFLCDACTVFYTNPLPLTDLEAQLANYCGPDQMPPIVGTLKASSLGRAFTPTVVERTRD